jgi:hypothetical protein
MTAKWNTESSLPGGKKAPRRVRVEYYDPRWTAAKRRSLLVGKRAPRRSRIRGIALGNAPTRGR